MDCERERSPQPHNHGRGPRHQGQEEEGRGIQAGAGQALPHDRDDHRDDNRQRRHERVDLHIKLSTSSQLGPSIVHEFSMKITDH